MLLLHKPALLLPVGLMLATATAGPVSALDLLKLKDQLEARRHNVLADNVKVYEQAPPVIVMFGAGLVSRRSTVLPGADNAARTVTAGNYAWAKNGAPWLVYQTYIGSVRSDTGLNTAGHLTAPNVLELRQNQIRPGGLHVRSNAMANVVSRID